MTNSRRQTKKKQPLISEADQKLWREWSQGLTPIEKSKNDRAILPDIKPAQVASGPQVERPITKPKNQPIAAAPTQTSPLAKFDEKTRRQLRSGHIEVSDRIDLHGMRQRDAHQELSRFLVSAQARGHRWVLVITGKGGPTDLESRMRPWLGNSQNERGVLRQNVPKWLSEPDLRQVVLSYSTAGPRHGGDGAIYVRLRARRNK